MAHVMIDSGPVDASDALRDVPQSKWFELMQVRRDFLGIHLPLDCRRLLEFVEDAEKMHRPLGFASIDDFIRHGLELEPQQVAWALDGLRQLKPNEPIPYRRAIELGKQGRPKKGEEKGRNPTISRRGRDYDLARLDRDGHTELATKVRAGELSANAAAIAAGFRKKPSPIELAAKALAKLTDIEWQTLKRDEDARRLAELH